jgi:uncharacterized protein (DUF1697 family)
LRKTLNLYVVLLRGINVGGKNVIPMSALVSMLESLGCQYVKTYIQSGNVVVKSAVSDGAVLQQQIADEIEHQHGFASTVLVMSATEFELVVAQNPFGDVEGKSLHFFFLASDPNSPDLTRMAEIKAQSERFELGKRVLILYAPEGIGRSRLAASVEKCVGVGTTARNWNTVQKLRSMIIEAG